MAGHPHVSSAENHPVNDLDAPRTREALLRGLLFRQVLLAIANTHQSQKSLSCGLYVQRI